MIVITLAALSVVPVEVKQINHTVLFSSVSRKLRLNPGSNPIIGSFEAPRGPVTVKVSGFGVQADGSRTSMPPVSVGVGQNIPGVFVSKALATSGDSLTTEVRPFSGLKPLADLIAPENLSFLTKVRVSFGLPQESAAGFNGDVEITRPQKYVRLAQEIVKASPRDFIRTKAFHLKPTKSYVAFIAGIQRPPPPPGQIISNSFTGIPLKLGVTVKRVGLAPFRMTYRFLPRQSFLIAVSFKLSGAQSSEVELRATADTKEDLLAFCIFEVREFSGDTAIAYNDTPLVPAKPPVVVKPPSDAP